MERAGVLRCRMKRFDDTHGTQLVKYWGESLERWSFFLRLAERRFQTFARKWLLLHHALHDLEKAWEVVERKLGVGIPPDIMETVSLVRDQLRVARKILQDSFNMQCLRLVEKILTNDGLLEVVQEMCVECGV